METPMVCNECLGQNPTLRMMKSVDSAQCGLCKRTFTVFAWRRHHGDKKKATKVCDICSKERGICQVCQTALGSADGSESGNSIQETGEASRQLETQKEHGFDCEWPSACEGCLKEVMLPYVRKVRKEFDGQCRICRGFFDTIKYRSDRASEYKITKICVACSFSNNLCQVCLLELNPTPTGICNLRPNGNSKKRPRTTGKNDESVGLPLACGSCLREIQSACTTKVRKEFNKKCRNCNRVFDSFKYRPNRQSDFKMTEICEACSTSGNMCQICFLVIEPNNHRVAIEPYDKTERSICRYYRLGNCKRGERCHFRHENA